MRMWVRSLGLLSGLEIWHCYELVAVAPIQPLAWEPLYATGEALESNNNSNNNNNNNKIKPQTGEVTFRFILILQTQ